MTTGRDVPARPRVAWGLAERAISLVSPDIALRRYRARVAAENMRRSYESADKSPKTGGWRAGSTAADSEIAAAGSILRDRMRDLVRNNALAAQAVQVLVNNIVGYGIRPRANSGNKARDKRINRLWAEWSKGCDAHGHGTFEALQVLAVRGMIEGGETFAVRRTRPGRSRVPLQIELREPDHLDDARISPSGVTRRIVQGIEYDQSGRRTGYWMYPHHPGDTRMGLWQPLQSVRVDAADVAHLFERQRIQSRGVPWGAPAMRALRDLGDWQDAELTRKKMEASMVGFVFGDLDDGSRSMAPLVKDGQGHELEQFEPGLIAYVEGGKDIKFNQPSATPNIQEWNRVQMHIVAAGFRVPYALMTGDLSQANFASSRVGLNEFRRMIEQVQWQIVIPQFCQPIWDWFCEAAWAAGQSDTPEVGVEWGPPKFESVNPWQDAQTDLLEVRAGFATLSQMIAKRGYDPEQVLEEQARIMAVADGLKLVLDSDPRLMSQAGQSQAGEAGETDDPPADTATDD